MNRATQTQFQMLAFLTLALILIGWQIATGKAIAGRGQRKISRRERPRAYWELIAGQLVLFLSAWSLLYYLSINHP